MKQYKKKTLALVLASVVTVVGAFGADNYKNSLMSLNFEQGQGKAVRLNLLTRLQFDGQLNIIKTDAYTYVITLPETNNEVPPEYQLGDKIESINIKTFPYTTEQSGYTKVIVKTYDNIPLFPQTGLYLPAGSRKQIEPPPEPVSPEKASVPANIPAVNVSAPIHNSPSTPDVDIKESVKQFQPAASQNIKPAAAGQAAEMSGLAEETPNRVQEFISWALGIALFISLVIFFFLKAKEKIAEAIGEQGNYDLNDESEKNDKKKPQKESIKIFNKYYDKQT